MTEIDCLVEKITHLDSAIRQNEDLVKNFESENKNLRENLVIFYFENLKFKNFEGFC